MGSEPIDWTALAVLAATLLAMGYLLRRFLGKRHIQDRLMLRRLRVAGVKLDEPQDVAFILFVRHEDAAERLAVRFRADGFEVTRTTGEIQFTRGPDRKAGPQKGWIVTLARRMPVDPDEVGRMRAVLTPAVEERSGLYLGWQVKKR